MKAIRIHEYGGADALRVDEIETPHPAADEVLIRVAAAGINYADIMLCKGTYLMRPALPFTVGFEAAGTIEAVGENVQNWQVGQRVMAMLPAGGGYAEYALAKAAGLVPIPDGLDESKATAMLVQGLTALGLLRELKQGQTILIHAAAGGVGTILVQLAKHKGATVIGTASSREKLETIKNLGADYAINYAEEGWIEQVMQETREKGADLIIEMVGGEIGRQNIKLLAQRGTMIIYGSASGEDFQVSALDLFRKSATAKGYVLYDETPESMMQFTRELMQHIASGRLQILAQEFPLEQAAEAHRAVEGRKTIGKVVLKIQ